MQREDLPAFLEWLNDPDVNRWLASLERAPADMQEEQAWYESARSMEGYLVWSIENLDGRLLGNMAIHVSAKNRRALLGMFIGEKTCWGRGYATDAIKSLLGYAFDELDLNRVELHVDESNARAIRCFQKCGFEREGVLREHRVVDGRSANSIQMAILARDWAEHR